MSQTIANGLQSIINAKSNIDSAVEAKGGIVTKGLKNSADDIMTIPNGEGPSYRSAVLWDYTTDNDGTIPYEPFIGTLHDSINNYDAIQLEMVSYRDDLDTSDWNATMFSEIIPVYVLNNSLKNNYFNHTSFETRSTNWYIKDTTIQKVVTNLSDTNGLVRVYGIQFCGGGGTVADEDALIELVDSGAKNLSEWAGGTTETDDSFVVQNEPITLKQGTYVISFDTTADSGSCEVVFYDENDNVGSHTFDNISSSKLSSEITLTADAIKFNLFTTKAATITNFMICTKAAWGMSHEYQPYRPSYQELYEQTETNENTISSILDGTTIDSFGDVETALSNKQNTIDSSHKLSAELVDNSTPVFATATQGGKADTAIQGIKVNSSTVNPDSNKVINITVPTSAADVSALPDTTKYAAALSLTINSSTFVVTGQLKDQNGDNLGTAQTIDLPLESVVVGGSYDSQTKKVVLTLQNGNTVEFSVADLVSGLQTELSTSNKLNPAFIEYDSTHRAVSDTEKSTWNGKQNALTTAQLSAVNSGIDSTKVAQIETNENNISYIANNSVKNIVKSIATSGGIFTVNADGTITANGTNTGSTATFRVVMYITPAEAYKLNGMILNGCPSGGNTGGYRINLQLDGGAYTNYAIDKGSGATISGIPQNPSYGLRLIVAVEAGRTVNNIVFKPMIRPAGIGDDTYVPYALSNADLTAKEQSNENNILLNWETNRNVYDWHNKIFAIGDSTTFTDNNNGTYTVTKSATTAGNSYNYATIHLDAGSYVLTGCPSGYSGIVLEIRTIKNFATIPGSTDLGSGSSVFTITTSGDYRLNILLVANITVSNITFKPMITPSSVYYQGISYQPYALSNAELTEKVERYTSYHTTAFSTANAWTYTDLSFTIPANQIYYFIASVSWSSGQPLEICLSTSATAGGVAISNIIAQSNVQGNIVTCTGQMTADNNSAVTIYCYAKNNSATGSSPTRLTAFRIA